MLGKKACFKITLFFLLGGIVLFSEGCSVLPVVLPVMGEKNSIKENGFLSVKPRISLEAERWRVKKLGRKIQTTSVHPDDSGFLTGETTADLKGEKKVAGALTVGLVGLIGDDDLKLKIGGDLRYNFLSHEDDYHEGLYDWRQQVSDTRPPSQGSFVFSQLIPDHFTYIPFVGVETKLSESLLLGIEMGFPYMEWEVRSGHDRWARWETIQRDSWRGFGRRYTGSILYKISEDNELFLSPFYEKYSPKFAGEGAKIDAFGVFLGMRFRF